MVNLHRPHVIVHMAYQKTLLFWAGTVAVACLGKLDYYWACTVVVLFG